MNEELRSDLPSSEFLLNLVRNSELTFAQGGNLNNVPTQVTVEGEEKPRELIGEFKVPTPDGERPEYLLNVPSLFITKGDRLEYGLKTEVGEPDLKTFSILFHALQQELTNTVAQISTNMYFVGRKVEVSQDQLSSAENLEDALKIIESLNKNTDNKTDLLSTVLHKIERFKAFFDNLVPVLEKTSNLKDFSPEVLQQLQSEVDAYLQTIDFEHSTDRSDLFKRMGLQLGEMASHYSQDKESWFYQFLVFASFVRAFDKTQEFVAVQIESVAPQLVGRWIHSDEDQPPADFPTGDQNREDQ